MMTTGEYGECWDETPLPTRPLPDFVPTHRFKGRLCRVLEGPVTHDWYPTWADGAGSWSPGCRIQWRGSKGKLCTQWVHAEKVKELAPCNWCDARGTILVNGELDLRVRRCPRCKGLGKV